MLEHVHVYFEQPIQDFNPRGIQGQVQDFDVYEV